MRGLSLEDGSVCTHGMGSVKEGGKAPLVLGQPEIWSLFFLEITL